MASWERFHGWMAFENMDQGDGLTMAFTIGYRFTDDSSDEWTKRFNRFKAKRRSALRGGKAVMEKAVPGLVKQLGLDASKTVFIPALSSGETVASEKGVLWLMTRFCARCADVRFVGDAITKEAHKPLHQYFNAERRGEILDGADFRSKGVRAKHFLVFDDFITRGDTLSHIAQAILDANPRASVYGIGLSKTERRRYHRETFGVELSNDHVPERWVKLWNEGEAG